LEIPKAGIEVLLDNINAPLNAGLYLVAIDFEPSAFDSLSLFEVCEQTAIAAAKVEHAAIGFDPSLDYFLIRTHR
jgi:hypothetical protein